MADGHAPRLSRTASIVRAATALVAAIAAFAAPAVLPEIPFAARALRTLLLVFVAAPTALLALPAAAIAPVSRVLAPLSRPLLAFVLFACAVGLAFVPACVDAALGHPALDAACALLQAAAALAAWWGACAPVGAAGRLRDPAAMALLFAFGIPHQIAAGTVATARSALYAGIPLGEQRDGAVLLWVPGGLILWLGITALWAHWARAARRDDEGAPPLTIPGGASDDGKGR